MTDSVQQLVVRLAKLDVSDVADQFDRFGLVPPVLARELKPIGPKQKFCGPAFCISGHKLNTAGWLAMPTGRDSLYDSLDESVPAGAVLLFATGGYDDAAVLGGGTGLALRQRGVDQFRQCGLPVLARAVSAIQFVGRFAITAVNVAIEMRGLAGIVQALTGDLVLCDADGAIIVPGGLAQHVIDATEKAAAVNAQVRAEILRGVPRLQATRKYNPD